MQPWQKVGGRRDGEMAEQRDARRLVQVVEEADGTSRGHAIRIVLDPRANGETADLVVLGRGKALEHMQRRRLRGGREHREPLAENPGIVGLERLDERLGVGTGQLLERRIEAGHARPDGQPEEGDGDAAARARQERLEFGLAGRRRLGEERAEVVLRAALPDGGLDLRFLLRREDLTAPDQIEKSSRGVEPLVVEQSGQQRGENQRDAVTIGGPGHDPSHVVQHGLCHLESEGAIRFRPDLFRPIVSPAGWPARPGLPAPPAVAAEAEAAEAHRQEAGREGPGLGRQAATRAVGTENTEQAADLLLVGRPVHVDPAQTREAQQAMQFPGHRIGGDLDAVDLEAVSGCMQHELAVGVQEASQLGQTIGDDALAVGGAADDAELEGTNRSVHGAQETARGGRPQGPTARSLRPGHSELPRCCSLRHHLPLLIGRILPRPESPLVHSGTGRPDRRNHRPRLRPCSPQAETAKLLDMRPCGLYALLLLVAGAWWSGSPPGQRARARTSGALVVPIEGVVSFRTAALVRRGLSDASTRGAARVILDIDTPGGLVTSMDEVVTILKLLREEGVETIAYVRRQALSAGAVIALACKRIFMAEGATIGDAVPVLAGGVRGVIEDEVREKYLSAFRADVRAIAEHHGDDVKLMAEAMVDARVSLVYVAYTDRDGLRKTRVMKDQQLEILRTQAGVEILDAQPLGAGPLTLTTVEAVRTKLAESIANSLEDLLRELAIGPKEWERLEPTWSEELAGFLHGIRMFLLIGGVLMAIFALKTPGTGVPEALAVLCFGAFFAGNWLVGLAQWTEILLFVFGIGLILVEIFVIPGTIVSGLLGFLMVVAALFLSLQPFVVPGSAMEEDLMRDNLLSLVLAVLLVVACAVLLSRFLPRIPMFRTLILEQRNEGLSYETMATTEKHHSPLLGKRGFAVTDLRPAGKADIDGQLVDVVASGTFIEKESVVCVVQVEGNRIVVEPVASDSGQVSIPWLIFMVFLGLLAMVAEVFFPSGGILGVVSAVLAVASIFLAFQHGPETGMGFLASVGILAPITLLLAFKWLDKSRWGRRIILSGPTFEPRDHKVRDIRLDDCIGKQGTALTPLRPSGTVEIEGQKFDAMTRGEIVEPGARVRVLRVELAQLVVAGEKVAGARRGPEATRNASAEGASNESTLQES